MRYDLAVIGGGSAGLAAATFAAGVGARVVVIEAERLGGECTWTGCVPSKALIHVARVVHQARASTWLETGGVDFAAAMAPVREAVRRVAESETADALGARGIDVLLGPARFVSPGVAEVDGRRLEARRFVVCTGAEPVLPAIPGLRESAPLTYRTVFDLDRLPARLLVLGAGPLGVELAQALRRLGASIAVLEQADRILPAVDPEAAAAVERRLRAEGVDLVLAAEVVRIENGGGEVTAVVAGRHQQVTGDAVLVAAGRRPRVAGLGLEEIGVALTQEGIRVDHSLRTSVRDVYAAGDVTGGPQFTHSAVWQGYAAARNALFPGRTRGERTPVPWAVFTDPEVGQAGIAEAEAGGRGVEVHRWPLERIDRAQAEGELEGFIKLIVGRRDRLLGATIVSAGAGELANLIVQAMDAGVGLAHVARALYVYPTRSYGLWQLAAGARMSAAASSWQVRLVRRLSRVGGPQAGAR